MLWGEYRCFERCCGVNIGVLRGVVGVNIGVLRGVVG